MRSCYLLSVPLLIVALQGCNASVIEFVPDQTEPNNKIALTFDDGPQKTYTIQILDALKKYDAKATFFVVGERVESHSGILLRMKNEGHQIGNHTWDHKKLHRLSDTDIREQIDSSNKEIFAITGELPRVLRPPNGIHTKRVTSVAHQPIIMWSVDTFDWLYRNADHTIAKVTESTKTGSIILMHDLYQSSSNAVPAILERLSARGFEFVTVDELLGFDENPGVAIPGKVYYKATDQDECYDVSADFPTEILQAQNMANSLHSGSSSINLDL